MTAQVAQLPTASPMPPLTLQELRQKASEIRQRRLDAVADYEAQIEKAAKAEAEYQKRKATKIVRLKNEGLSATEAVERAKGDDWVCEAQIDRDTQHELLKAKLERIAGIDGDRATLHRMKRRQWTLHQFADVVRTDGRPPLEVMSGPMLGRTMEVIAVVPATDLDRAVEALREIKRRLADEGLGDSAARKEAWIHANSALASLGSVLPSQRVERASARGQRISRQPWKAWNRHGRYLGVFRTRREAQRAADTDTQPAGRSMIDNTIGALDE